MAVERSSPTPSRDVRVSSRILSLKVSKISTWRSQSYKQLVLKNVKLGMRDTYELEIAGDRNRIALVGRSGQLVESDECGILLDKVEDVEDLLETHVSWLTRVTESSLNTPELGLRQRDIGQH